MSEYKVKSVELKHLLKCFLTRDGNSCFSTMNELIGFANNLQKYLGKYGC